MDALIRIVVSLSFLPLMLDKVVDPPLSRLFWITFSSSIPSAFECENWHSDPLLHFPIRLCQHVLKIRELCASWFLVVELTLARAFMCS